MVIVWFISSMRVRKPESKEYNQLYIIFSPNPLTKTIDRSTTELMPRETTVENFRKWLARCRRNDLDMAVEVKNIVIKGHEK